MSLVVFFSFSKGYRVWEILKSQWNPPNSTESELELKLQFHYWSWNCRNPTGRRPVGSENPPGVVGITRAGMEAEGRNGGRRPECRPEWCPPRREDFPIPRAVGPWDFHSQIQYKRPTKSIFDSNFSFHNYCICLNFARKRTKSTKKILEKKSWRRKFVKKVNFVKIKKMSNCIFWPGTEDWKIPR